MKSKVVVFDAYGTLFDVNSLDRLLNDYFGEASTELSALWRKKQLEYTWLRTLMKRYRPFSEVTLDALSFACNMLRLELTNDIKNHLKTAYLRLQAFPEVKSVLTVLHQQTSLAVLSNADRSMLQGALETNQLTEMFNQVLSADDIQKFKPRPEVYEMVCKAFSCLPQEVLFVSSNTWDVAGAKSFGLRVAWLNRAHTIGEELQLREDYRLTDLSQLQSL